MVANVVAELVMTWHRCLGHVSKQGLKVHFDRNLFPGLNIDFYEDCLYDKHCRASFLSSYAKSFDVLELIYSERWADHIESLPGSSYIFLY